MIGRASELALLGEALDAAAAGSGSTVLVAGEAGIGKTRLANELATRARDAGFEVLGGRCLDLVGTELPYQPFVEALRPLGELRREGSQLRVFEDTLSLLTESTPVLLVLEDLHWADTSTLDLAVFLAHNLVDQQALLVGTYRADERVAAERLHRLAEGVRRSGSTLLLELGPLEREEVTALLAARAGAPPPLALTEAIVARSEGNPFFAEELLHAAGDEDGELPRVLRDLLLQRVARLDRRTQDVLRLAAAAGRDVGYSLLCAAVALPVAEVRESLRAAVEHGVLVADQASDRFRFRHALLAEAIYTTLLPGERQDLHARLADELAGAEPPAAAAELAPHWEAAGRAEEALAASIEAAREAESVFGLAEARAHLERALRLWDAVPDPAVLAGLDLAKLCMWAAQLSSQTGAAPRAVELTRRAISLVGEGNPVRAALLHERLGAYLFASGSRDAALAARERAVELVPPEPPSPERAQVLAALGNALMLRWRHDESLPVCEEALALARRVGARRAEFTALAILGVDLAYLGRAEEGLADIRSALRLAEESQDPWELFMGYGMLTDVLTMLGRPRESARVGAEGVEALRPFWIDMPALVANRVEALVAIGEWDEADRVSAEAVRAITASWPHMTFVNRAELEIGRGDFDAAREHFEAALATVREDDRSVQTYDPFVIELALWERRWEDAEAAVRDALVRASARDAAQIRVRLCAQGLRAQAELAALARARRDSDGLDEVLGRARALLAAAQDAAAESEYVTPNVAGWRALAEAEFERAEGRAQPDAWAEAAATWNQLERPPLAAYCSWRQAEALVASGATRTEAAVALREAHAVAARIGARPLLREVELLAERARLDLAPPEAEPRQAREMEDTLGLTAREAEVLELLGRGYTNREIADALVISVKTAGVHVSHILQKLGVPNRVEAAAVAHRVASGVGASGGRS